MKPFHEHFCFRAGVFLARIPRNWGVCVLVTMSVCPHSLPSTQPFGWFPPDPAGRRSLEAAGGCQREDRAEKGEHGGVGAGAWTTNLQETHPLGCFHSFFLHRTSARSSASFLAPLAKPSSSSLPLHATHVLLVRKCEFRAFSFPCNLGASPHGFWVAEPSHS